MAATKLRIKFGEHEFDAQGPVDVLREQFQLFLRLVAPQAEKALAAFPVADDTSPLRKIVRMRGRIARVTVPAKTDDLVLLLMQGHKVLRKNNSVSGADIMDGLRASGAPVRRADKILRGPVTDPGLETDSFLFH
jgi:hypothetical protein